MVRISIVESGTQRKLVLEGKLVAPWTAELRLACREARADLENRELVVELRDVTVISQEGENLLLDLMQEGIAVRCAGMFSRCVISELSRRVQNK